MKRSLSRDLKRSQWRQRTRLALVCGIGGFSLACEGKPLCMTEEYDVELLEVREPSGDGVFCPSDVDLPRTMSIRPLGPGGSRGVGVCQHQGIEYIEALGEETDVGVEITNPPGFRLAGNLRPRFRYIVKECDVSIVARFYFSDRYSSVEGAFIGSQDGDREAFRWGYGLRSKGCAWLEEDAGYDHCSVYYQAVLTRR